jgi:hypothetical protein
MNTPLFTAESSLTASTRAAGYVVSIGVGAPARRVTPQQAASLGAPFWADCVINCIQRGGGSDPSALIQYCTSLCRRNPWVVF